MPTTSTNTEKTYLLDNFGNDILLGDEVAYLFWDTLEIGVVNRIDELGAYSNKHLVASRYSSPTNNYGVVVNTTKREKEGAVNYLFLNSQLDGGS